MGGALREFRGAGAAPLPRSRLGTSRGSRGEGLPRGVWGTAGAHFPLLPLKFYLPPASPALEGGFWKLPASPVCPLPRLLRSYSEELGGGGSRADPLATSTLPPGRVQAGVGFCCVYSCTRAFLIFFTPIIICGISILGTGGFSAAFLSEKAFCYLWCEGGDLASGKLVGAFRVRLSLLRSPPPISNLLTDIDAVCSDLKKLSCTCL